MCLLIIKVCLKVFKLLPPGLTVKYIRAFRRAVEISARRAARERRFWLRVTRRISLRHFDTSLKYSVGLVATVQASCSPSKRLSQDGAQRLGMSCGLFDPLFFRCLFLKEMVLYLVIDLYAVL